MLAPSQALLLSLLVLAAGHFLAHFLEQRQRLRAFLDGFVLVMVGGLCLLFLLPHAYGKLGLGALPLAVVGLGLPALAERLLERRHARESQAVIVLAVLGLLVHSGLDGAALAISGGGHGHGHGHAHGHGHGDGAGLEITAAILAHRLPVGLLLGTTVAQIVGRGWALAGLALICAATVGGFVLSPHVVGAASSQGAGVVEAILAGGLLHVAVGHEAPCGDRFAATSSGVGAAAALAAFALLPLEPLEDLNEGLRAGVHLFLESSPAILLGFLGAGLLSLVPTELLSRLMVGKTALGSAVRGVVFGLPIPICSCGVVPLYRGLMEKGVPPAAAIAFLIATPELGLDSVLLSVPLLGIELTVTRVLAAFAVAVVSGLAVSALVAPGDPPPAADAGDPCAESDSACGPEPADPESPASRGVRLRGALAYGFGDAVDELGPWMLAGLLAAGMLQPILDPGWMSALPDSAQVPVFSALAAPFYMCASAATPLGAVLLLKGVAAGAVIAFLLTGPATNLTTYGAIRLFHGRGVTFLAIAAMLAASVAVGLLVNGLPLSSPQLAAEGEHAAGLLQQVAGALFAGLLVVSLLRQGPRGYLKRLGISGHTHEHGDHAHAHTHEHGHAHPDDELNAPEAAEPGSR